MNANKIQKSHGAMTCLLVTLLFAGCSEGPGLDGTASRGLALGEGLRVELRAPGAGQGPIAGASGATCVELTESYDRPYPEAFAELCFNLDLGWQWSEEGPIEGKTCVRFAEPDDRRPDRWADNCLCYGGEGSAAADDIVVRWSSSGSYPTMSCVKVECSHCEPAEAWQDNYLCHATAPGKHLYRKLGGEDSWLRDPLPPERTALADDGVGGVQRFKHGVIYWHPRLGAFALPRTTWERWVALGGAGGQAGLPISDAEVLGHGPARVSHFQHGDIFDVPGQGKAYYLRQGPILERYHQLGWGPRDGVHPVSDVTPAGESAERAVFSNGATIYHRPGQGTFVVDRWTVEARRTDSAPGVDRTTRLAGYPLRPFEAEDQ